MNHHMETGETGEDAPCPVREECRPDIEYVKVPEKCVGLKLWRIKDLVTLKHVVSTLAWYYQPIQSIIFPTVRLAVL